MNLRDVRAKIKTVKNVRKITNAMQMVSAVKMKKAQKTALEGREYRRILDGILRKIMTSTADIRELQIPWLQATSGTKRMYVLVTSDKGLCGPFHSNLFRHVLKIADMHTDEFITVGEKGARFVAGLGGTVLADFSHHDGASDAVSAIFSLMEEKYLTGDYASISVVYNKFISSFKADPTTEQLLPIVSLDTSKEAPSDSSPYIIEPSAEHLLGPLLLDYLKEKMRSARADSEAAEHSARMMAMKAATDNAADVSASLTLLRNKLRQTQITNELLDMIAAMNA